MGTWIMGIGGTVSAINGTTLTVGKEDQRQSNKHTQLMLQAQQYKKWRSFNGFCNCSGTQ